MKYFIIGADIVPTKSNVELFCEGNSEELIGKDLAAIIQDSEYSIFNLETPLTDVSSPIRKCGPNLMAPTESIHALTNMGVDLFALANNHILDQGELGLKSTLKTLKNADIAQVGAGDSIKEAKRVHTFRFNNRKVGVFACCEHEFSCATDRTSGANPYDELYVYDYIEKEKNLHDYIIVLFHGGQEQYRYPTPNLQRICRHFVEKGADLVVCQHSHCIGCEEDFQSGKIIYGQGNFLFDYKNLDCWNTAVLIKIYEDYSIEYIPVSKKGCVVRLSNDIEKKEIMEGFKRRSNEIFHEGFVKDAYARYVQDYLPDYIGLISGNSKRIVTRILNRVTNKKYLKKLTKIYIERNGSQLLNYIECESHRELGITGLKKYITGEQP